jgi:hypothetical protein
VREFHLLIVRWQRAQTFDLTQRARQREIAARPHIRTTERHQEVDVDAPRAKAGYVEQHTPAFVIRRASHRTKIERAVEHTSREPVTVRRLLTSHTDLPQSSHTNSIDVVWRHTADVFVDAAIHGGCRSQRHLLLENDFYECGESGAAAPDWRIAEALMNARQIRVARCEMARPFSEERARE